MGRLDVRIVEARNLPDMDTFGKSDPYVKVTVENHTMKTEVANNTLNPKWDQVCKFVLADPNSSQLELTLWNSNMVSDDFMGRYNMNLSGLVKGQVKDQWCLLQQCKSNAEIRIRLLPIDFGADAGPVGGQQMQQQQQGGLGGAIFQTGQPQTQPGMYQQQPGYPQQQQQNMYQQQQQPQYQQQQQQPMYQQQQPMMMQQQQQPQMFQQQQQQQPSQTFQDFQFVQFRGPVRRATYGPAGSNNDFTMQVNAMIQRGQTSVSGGIHTVIGDPAPGTAKQFCVWY